MTVYKVGGCVRDHIMGVESRDVDFVVTNSSIQEMLDLDFKIVGNDFPVFLHPQTGEEYALARTERKIGKGYNGFEFTTEGVTIEEDLGRRDLTINAMASTPAGLIDPYGGKQDIKNKILRHVNAEAFKEDPVRVLRIARFLARWPAFSVAKETMTLCKEIVQSGEMDHLTVERITLEFMKALKEPKPSRFFYFLEMVGALKILFPEIHALVGVPAGKFEHHPEGDSFIHTMMVLDQAGMIYNDPIVKFAALVHDLGKGNTPADILPHHYGHEGRGFVLVKQMSDRLKLPNEYREYGMWIAKFHTHIHNFHKLNPKTIVNMADEINLKKNKNMFIFLPVISDADHRGRTSFFEYVEHENRWIATDVLEVLTKFKMSDHFDVEELQKMKPQKIADLQFKKKVELVKEMMSAKI